MLLTATTKYINQNLYPALIGIIEVGIVFRIIMKGIDAQTEGLSFSEFLNQIKKLIVAGIIGIVIGSLVAVFQKYYK